MEFCKEVLDKASKEGDYVSSLQLFVKLDSGGTRATGAHKVKLISDKVIKGKDYKTKQEIYKIELLLEEDGVKKSYSFRMKDKDNPKKPHYLVERFANIKAGTEVILEGKKSGKASYIDVFVVEGQGEVSEEKEDNIPIIEENENINEGSKEYEIAADSPKES